MGFLLMAILLALPILRECCLPTMAALHHCHQSGHSENWPCSPNPAAVTENKTTVEFSTVDFGFAGRVVRDSGPFETANTAAIEFTLARPNTSTDLYLRTSVLLI
jgi:hypothetical protein